MNKFEVKIVDKPLVRRRDKTSWLTIRLREILDQLPEDKAARFSNVGDKDACIYIAHRIRQAGKIPGKGQRSIYAAYISKEGEEWFVYAWRKAATDTFRAS